MTRDTYTEALASLPGANYVIIDIGEIIKEILVTESEINSYLSARSHYRVRFELVTLIAELISCIESKQEAQDACINLAQHLHSQFQDDFELKQRCANRIYNSLPDQLFEGIYQAGVSLMMLFDSEGFYKEDGLTYLRFCDTRAMRAVVLEKYLDAMEPVNTVPQYYTLYTRRD